MDEEQLKIKKIAEEVFALFLASDDARIRRVLREELAGLLGSDRYIFQKDIQIFDGRNIQTGKTTGTMFGTATDQKIGFLGTAPRVRYQFAQPFTAADIGAALESFGLGYH